MKLYIYLPSGQKDLTAKDRLCSQAKPGRLITNMNNMEVTGNTFILHQENNQLWWSV